MKVKVSIIVPVYNAEPYLRACLDSLINQTEQSIQIICVDDGSTDHSIDILREYAYSDHRIRVLQQANSGVCVSRNIGMEYASGEYIMFVDADDWIDLDTCEQALKEAEREAADVVIWSYVREYNNNSVPKKIFLQDRIVLRNEEVESQLHRRYVGMMGNELARPENIDSFNTVPAKLYKKSLISQNNIQFDKEQTVGEDLLFNLNIFGFVTCAVCIDRPMYHYRRDNSQSNTNAFRPKLLEQFNRLHSVVHEYLKNGKYDGTYYEAFYNRVALSLIGLGLNVARGG